LSNQLEIAFRAAASGVEVLTEALEALPSFQPAGAQLVSDG
jgi:hypothetical protein